MSVFRSVLFCGALALLLGQAGHEMPAAPPEPAAAAVITDLNGNPAPERFERGGVLYFSAAQSSTGAGPRSVIWIVRPPQCDQRSRTFDGGRTLVVPCTNTAERISVELIVAQGDEADRVEVELQVDGPAPDPKPNPDPRPTPVPDPPDWLQGDTGRAMWRAVWQVDEQHRPLAVRVGGAVSAAIGATDDDAMANTENQALVDNVAAQLKQVLTAEQKTAWEPWREAYLAELNRLQDAGELDGEPGTVPAWRRVMTEIALATMAAGNP